MHVVEEGDPDADRLAASIRTRMSGTDRAPDVRLAEGPAAQAIMKTADREDAELLVIGSRGRGALRSVVLGSVSRELAARARCPVVVVPSGERWAKTPVGVDAANASVVCGVDGSDQALAAAALAGRLARRLGWRLVLVHARQTWRAVAAYPGASATTPPLSGQEDRESARLVMIAAQGVGTARAALLGSVAADLPVAAARPLVVLTPAAAAVVRAGP